VACPHIGTSTVGVNHLRLNTACCLNGSLPVLPWTWSVSAGRGKGASRSKGMLTYWLNESCLCQVHFCGYLLTGAIRQSGSVGSKHTAAGLPVKACFVKASTYASKLVESSVLACRIKTNLVNSGSHTAHDVRGTSGLHPAAHRTGEPREHRSLQLSAPAASPYQENAAMH
jgi:hypothetical protein